MFERVYNLRGGRLRTLVMAAVGMATLASCAVVPQTLTYQATVDAIAAPNASAKRRYFLRHIEAGKEGDLQFLEFGAYVHHALERRGFIRAESVADADIVIGLGYAIGDSETYSYTYRVPRWGQTGIASANTSGSVSADGSYSATTTYNPTYGVTGYSTGDASETTFTRMLLLWAYNGDEYRKGKWVKVWETSVASTGTSNDLRRVFPYMVAAMLPYIGENSFHKIEISVPEDSALVMSLR
jgi:hypothetical protein